jgi:hypothetical protein
MGRSLIILIKSASNSLIDRLSHSTEYLETAGVLLAVLAAYWPIGSDSA